MDTVELILHGAVVIGCTGQIEEPDVEDLDPESLPPTAKRAAFIFLGGVAFVIITGLFDGLRPMVGTGDDRARVSVAITIQVVMGVVAALILLVAKAKGNDVAKQSTFTSGTTGAIVPVGLSLGLTPARGDRHVAVGFVISPLV